MEKKCNYNFMKENGVAVDSNFGNAPKMKVKALNTKLRLFREFVLATLNSLVKSKKGGPSSYITACDLFAKSGIVGLQWKKHLKTQVHVSLADHDSLSKLISNAEMNDMTATQLFLNSVRVPGDPVLNQEHNEVHIYQADARTLLSMESFQFVYLHPFKNSCEFTETAFHSVSHGGLICFVISDVSSFVRSPHVIKRQYGARVIKTEYWKELATRIVLASMAQAAARCNKGMIPLYVVSIEDYLLVCVKVARGHANCQAALDQIAHLMHCRICEERVFVEIQLAPDENPYSNLPCKCKQSNPGKTAVILGPLWKGDIFDGKFLSVMKLTSTDLQLSNSFTDTISSLIVESSTIRHLDKCNMNKHKSTEQNSNDDGCDTSLNNGMEKKTLDNGSESTDSVNKEDSLKRKHANDEERVDVKKMCKETELWKDKKDAATYSQSCNVPFYYNANNKAKSKSLPRLDKLIIMLQKEGYLASRTHFDPCAVRTSATIEQFLNVLS